MNKKFISMTLSVLMCSSVVASMPVTNLSSMTHRAVVMASEKNAFSDLSSSKYSKEITKLCDMGIISSDGGKFNPGGKMDREDAAEILVKAFKLPRIHPLIIPDKVKKQFIRADAETADLEAPADETFAVPTAQDAVNDPKEPYIEGVLKVNALEAENGLFKPKNIITQKDFILAICKIIFGTEEKTTDYSKKLSSIGVLDSKLLASTEPITREEAAHYIYSIAANPNFKVITVLSTSDIHGHAVPYKPGTSKYEIGGMSRVAEISEETRQYQKDTLMVDVGDAPYNMDIVNMFKGRPIIEAMNIAGYDSMTLGNHDFDFPLTAMQDNAKIAKFPFLSANTYYKNKPLSFLKPYTIKNVDGIKVALVGVTDDQSLFYTHPDNIKNISLSSDFDTAKKVVKEVRNKSDLVIALPHMHEKNEELAQKVDGIDVEVGGGLHTITVPKRINGTYYLTVGKYGEMVGQININLWNKKPLGENASDIFLSQNIKEEPQVKKLMDQYNSKLDSKLNDKIGYTNVFLDGERGTVRYKESNLGDLMTDALREYFKADIAIQNGGGIRESIQKGDITNKDMYRVLPFDDRIILVEATGKTIWDAIEHGIEAYPGTAGQFPQVSGLKYTFDASKAPGHRLVSITVGNEPIDLNKTYKLATNDYLTGGGDKYDMLKPCKVIYKVADYYLRNALTDYILKNKSVSPKTEGRITVLNPFKQPGETKSN